MSQAEKLLARMQRTLSGWGQDDFDTLYKGYGFSCKEGSKHRLYYHEDHPELIATVGRHDDLAKGYASHAIKTIDKLQTITTPEITTPEETENDGT